VAWDAAGGAALNERIRRFEVGIPKVVDREPRVVEELLLDIVEASKEKEFSGDVVFR